LPNLQGPSPRIASVSHRHYPVSAVLRTSPPPQSAWPVPHGLPVGHCSDHAMGLPVLRTLSLCTCCRHYPGAASGRIVFAQSPSRVSLPRKGRRVGLRIVLFEACSAFARVTACTLALSPIRDTHPEGFSYFVTSIAAPAASGWSGRRAGLCTHWKAAPCHGAHPRRTLPWQDQLYNRGHKTRIRSVIFPAQSTGWSKRRQARPVAVRPLQSSRVIEISWVFCF
jgi:hypothetical protein